ncbi:MAG: hypothetical protein PHD25_00815, partial [Bacteroidales bacterium]|nr:hypothetical protein [Bacteroidales bacterium]
NFFNMIFRILNQFTQNPDTLNHFKEHNLLTINMLIIIKDQLIMMLLEQFYTDQDIPWETLMFGTDQQYLSRIRKEKYQN